MSPSTPSPAWEQPHKFLSEWQWNNNADLFNGGYHERRAAVIKLLTDYRDAATGLNYAQLRQQGAEKEQKPRVVALGGGLIVPVGAEKEKA